ncbi:crotonase/enoyl-CoA hydratase family protein [Maricaulis virginensis]|nr:crotonase/enoyl-CoA hydratase family protein [Maricaulis virginensis]
MTQPRTFHDRVAVSLDDHIARIEMIREDKLNALDPAMFDALIEAAAWLREQRDARVTILSGRGRMFCAGLDFGSFAAMAGEDGAASTSLEPRTHGLCNTPQYAAWAWHEAPVPVIVAIQGGALGGGLQIALGGDIRIAAPDAKIAIAETQWGLVPDMSGMARVRRLVRDDVLRRLTYTAERIDGTRAREAGLVTEVHPDPQARALEIAQQIANRSPSAIRACKVLLNGLDDANAGEILAAESRLQQAIIGKPNQVEAVMANLDKRTPQFGD